MAALAILDADRVDDDLLLKVTPPRVPRQLLSRPRLLAGAEALRDCQAILLQAPAGFGKTSLAAQWRLEHVARGSSVAWVSAQVQDDPARLLQTLALAVRVGAGRPNFGHNLVAGRMAQHGLAGIAAWLTELAQAALDLMLIVDDADRLPAASREALAYVLHNAPPNLRTVVVGRGDCGLAIKDLVDYGRCTTIGPAALRFRLDETLQLVHGRFGKRVDNDTAARLQELTEGWPLGLQLVLSAMGVGDDVCSELSAMAAHGGELRKHLVELLLPRLNLADTTFLTRTAALDQLHPDLCRAIEDRDDAPEQLQRLSRDAPFLVGSEHSEWSRMHKLARESLRQRFEALAADEQTRVHARAAEWLEHHGLLEDAAAHALKAGQPEVAYDLAERSFYDALMKRGRLTAVLEWASRMPLAELERRPRLLLAFAWALAVSERHDEAGRMVDRLLSQPGASDALRCECALILGAAAILADRPDRFAALHDPWAEAPPLTDPALLQVHANRCAYRALIDGEPALARLRQQEAPHGALGSESEHLDHWGHFIVGLSYLAEGQAVLAEKLLQPVLASAEAASGRRGRFACMLAALLAAALWEGNRPAEASAVLADRLDVIERCGVPDAVLLAYRTLARMAIAEGAEHRAIELLDVLEAVGTARRLPRLVIASLAEQVRLHARRYRAQTCRELCARIDALVANAHPERERLWRLSVAPMVELAHAYTAIASQAWRAALESLERGDELCRRLRLGQLHIKLLGLKAFALHRCGEDARAHLREAMDLAQAYGLKRVLGDAHPDLDAWMRTLTAEERVCPPAVMQSLQVSGIEPPRAAASAAVGSLTVKEREVLGLLARSLSNKEIGRAMQAGETTIKWHVKNLFSKLDVGSRKEVVRRARILGMLPPAD